MPIAVMNSPEQQPGNQRCFCSSVPNEAMYGTTTSECSAIAKPLSYMRASSSMITVEARKSAPAPPRLVRNDLALGELAERSAEGVVLLGKQRAVHARAYHYRGLTARPMARR